MPMPLWWGQINKRIFNPGALERGSWPVLRHVGRSSGETHRTPLGVDRYEGGYVFVLVYGREADWVQNVLAAGEATLEIDGDEVELTGPRVVPPAEAFTELAEDTKRPPKLLRISECLVMDAVSQPAEPARRS